MRPTSTSGPQTRSSRAKALHCRLRSSRPTARFIGRMELVIAFEVDHGDVIKPAYGYRIEYGGRSVVISGDTRFNENVIKFGTGADLLIHEVAIARPQLMVEGYIQRIMAHHTTAREAGVVFARTGPKLAAYTHLGFLASKDVPPATVADLIAETRTSYDGPLEVGEDLMCFEIGHTVSVKRAAMSNSR